MRHVAMIAILAVSAFALSPAVAGGASSNPETGASHERLVKVIDDPSTGARWLLYEDTGHPSWPARLVAAPPEQATKSQNALRREASADGARVAIHAGDRLTVEEHTPVADSKLSAVALGQARKGEELEVRLEIGGRVVKAVAEGTGQAQMVGESGARP